MDPPIHARDLLHMSRAQLDALFARGETGALPDGAASGIALLAPGTPFNDRLASIVELAAWKGKTFFARYGVLTNRITPLGIPSVVAVVYVDASRFDGKPCIVLDYSKTSLVAGFIRDEIRLIAPGLYVGRVYIGAFCPFGFALQF